MQGRTIKMLVLAGLLAFGLGLPAGHAQTAAADSVAKLYKGKTITWVVSAEPGGSTDIITRILVPHVGRQTGARIVVKNMTGPLHHGGEIAGGYQRDKDE